MNDKEQPGSVNCESTYTAEPSNSIADDEFEATSSYSQQVSVVGSDLTYFREKWHSELQQFPEVQVVKYEGDTQNIETNPEEHDSFNKFEDEASSLYLKGAEMEKAGKLYEAIQHYRRAIQLVPDIEVKLYNLSRLSKEPEYDENSEEEPNEEITCSDEDSSDPDDTVLLQRIKRKMLRKSAICTPEFVLRGSHISTLPLEIILYILRWLVSSDLDLRSLEMVSRVCRGFYVCSRDPEIWRSACMRVWGVHCGSSPGEYQSWRSMFIDRPRLQFNGCYISKTTYIRHGENSFQDQFYRPWHFVGYYRYFRFFPDGVVLMLTSAEEPVQCINQLRYKNPRRPVSAGYYRLKDDKVNIVIHRQENVKVQNLKKNMRRNLMESVDQMFHMNCLDKRSPKGKKYEKPVELYLEKYWKKLVQKEFQIMGHDRKRHVRLIWTLYSIITRTRKGDETTSTFDLVNNKFPPLWFSRVRSYTAESESPLL